MTPPDPLRVLNNDLTLQGLQHTAHNSHSMSLYHLLWDKWSIDLAKWTLFLSDGQYQHPSRKTIPVYITNWVLFLKLWPSFLLVIVRLYYELLLLRLLSNLTPHILLSITITMLSWMIPTKSCSSGTRGRLIWCCGHGNIHLSIVVYCTVCLFWED